MSSGVRDRCRRSAGDGVRAAPLLWRVAVLDVVLLCRQVAPDVTLACDVLAIWAPGERVADLVYYGLYALQHRGQESAGMAVADRSSLLVYKDMGLVSQVFGETTLHGADSLAYLSLEALTSTGRAGGKGLCSACFTGGYPVPVDRQVGLDSGNGQPTADPSPVRLGGSVLVAT